jgi:very-short-patch-repair endonuclease
MHTDTVTRKRARRLRRDLTDAERILWSRLKGRRLGAQFRVQHPIAPYIADFACVSLKLIVEVDGATHSTPVEQVHDEHRRDVLERSGWTILRVWNDDVYRNLDGVIAAITDALLVLGTRGSPPPTR